MKRCPQPSLRAPLRVWVSVGGDERVVHRRVVSLICAGWLPQDGLFGSSEGPRSRKRASPALIARLGAARGVTHRAFAGPLTGAAVTTVMLIQTFVVLGLVLEDGE